MREMSVKREIDRDGGMEKSCIRILENLQTKISLSPLLCLRPVARMAKNGQFARSMHHGTKQFENETSSELYEQYPMSFGASE